MVPTAIGFSPTMQCNLSCLGCYARDYPQDNELSLDNIDELLSLSHKLSIFLCVVTGGEPLMKEGILEVFRRHRGILFLLVTNGTLLDHHAARQIALSGNIIPALSLEGFQKETDARRGRGTYDHVMKAMSVLEKEHVVFGFSATVARDNFETLSSNKFIEGMKERGCTLGYYTEYIPIGSAAQWELVLEADERTQFRKRLLDLRKTEPIMLVHLPEDEYFEDGRCRAMVFGSVHINSQGYVEPCPFSHFASDTLREISLEDALQSPFLTELRSSDAIIRRTNLGCALFENRELVQEIVDRIGAKPTDRF